MANVYKEHIDEIGKENETDFIQTVNSFSEYIRGEIDGHNGKSILIIAVDSGNFSSTTFGRAEDIRKAIASQMVAMPVFASIITGAVAEYVYHKAKKDNND